MKVITCFSYKGGAGRTTAAANIAAALGSRAIRQLHFKMMPKAPPPAKPRAEQALPPTRPERPLTAGEEAHLAAELENIKDPGLREQMRRIFIKALRRFPDA